MTQTTDLIHDPYVPPSEFQAVAPAVHKASTVIFPNVAALRQRDWRDKSAYTYGLHGTPTTFTLEARIAALEGAKHCLLVPSGLAGIFLVNAALLKAGDHVLFPDNAYGPGKDLARHELTNWGIEIGFYDPMNANSLHEKIQPNTRLVWLEAPGSITLEFPDLSALIAICRHRGQGIITAIDDTWGAGVAFKPFDFGAGQGADIAMHALTKYPSGGADVLMGAVCTCDDALQAALTMAHCRMGLGVGANDVELVLRGLHSMPLRYEAQDKTARALALHCASLRIVKQVLHPALPGSPGHEHWKTHCTAAAGLLTLELQPWVELAQAEKFIDALRLFRLGYSWGGPVSLVMIYDPDSARELSKPYAGPLIRFAAGLEEIQDLRADIDQALLRAGLI